MIPKRYRGIWDIVIHLFLLKKQVNVLINESYDRFHFFFFNLFAFAFVVINRAIYELRARFSGELDTSGSAVTSRRRWRSRTLRLTASLCQLLIMSTRWIEDETYLRRQYDTKKTYIQLPNMQKFLLALLNTSTNSHTIPTKSAEAPTRPTHHTYPFWYHPYQTYYSSNSPYLPHLPILIPNLPNLLKLQLALLTHLGYKPYNTFRSKYTARKASKS